MQFIAIAKYKYKFDEQIKQYFSIYNYKNYCYLYFGFTKIFIFEIT